MKQAVIVSAVRTPVGKAPKGTLRNTRPDDLGAIAVKSALERVPSLDQSRIDDVIIGCAMPEAEQGMNLARIISLRAGLPVGASAMTINRFCASACRRLLWPANASKRRSRCSRRRRRRIDVVCTDGGNKVSFNPWLVDNYPGSYLSMGLTAERVAKRYDISAKNRMRLL